MKRFFLLFGLCCIITTLKTQNWCGNHAPQAASTIAEAYAHPKTTVTIPVVVHVVWNTEAEMISEDQVRSQIDVLNQDFRAANTDLDDVVSFYQQFIADSEINFKLATSDPNGDPHEGIVYQPAGSAGIGSQFEGGRRRLCYDDLGGSSAWPTDCYLNIWVADLGIDGVAGIGIFPEDVGTVFPAEEDGVYIQSARFGTLGSVNQPYHLGRTTTHEIGHYLNLLHPWGRETPPDNCSPAVCCNDPQYDDFVADTEKQIRTYLGQCPGGGSIDCGNLPSNSQNFMGFAEDACALMFTEGQKTRMWETLMTSRASLLEKCTTSATSVTLQHDAWLDYAYWQGSQLRLAPLRKEVYWQLYNTQGQLMTDLGQLTVDHHAFDFSGWSAGLYILIGTDNGKYHSLKVLKL